MRRRVIKQGHNTLTVSLPRKWCLNHSLKEGEEIELAEKGNSLLVSKEAFRDSDEIKVDITGLDRSTIIILLQSLYTYGYDTINITTKDTKARYHLEDKNININQIVEYSVNRLIGAEITGSKKNYYKIQVLTEESKEKFSVLLRRIFRLMLELFDAFIERYEKNDKELIDDVEFKHLQIRKFTNYALRILNKYGHEEADKTTFYFSIVRIMIRISEMIKNLSGPRDKPMKASKKCCNMVTEIKEIFNFYYESFYKYDLKNFSEVHKRRDLFKNKLYYNHDKLSKDDLYIMGGILQVLEAIIELNELKMAVGR